MGSVVHTHDSCASGIPPCSTNTGYEGHRMVAVGAHAFRSEPSYTHSQLCNKYPTRVCVCVCVCVE
jgi:hypothetical protein